MVETEAADVPVPPQMPVPAHYDFRHASTAPHGVKRLGKRKLEDYAEQARAAMPHAAAVACFVFSAAGASHALK